MGWRLAIFLAQKTFHGGVLICDVTSSQSINGRTFVRDVITAFDQLELSSPGVFRTLHNAVQRVARADINNDFEYYCEPGLLLMRIDYQTIARPRTSEIVERLTQFANQVSRQI